jgi:LPXTG-motif cell wall-anchored protein
MTDAGTWALIYLFVDPLALLGGLVGLLVWRRRNSNRGG